MLVFLLSGSGSAVTVGHPVGGAETLGGPPDEALPRGSRGSSGRTELRGRTPRCAGAPLPALPVAGGAPPASTVPCTLAGARGGVRSTFAAGNDKLNWGSGAHLEPRRREVAVSGARKSLEAEASPLARDRASRTT